MMRSSRARFHFAYFFEFKPVGKISYWMQSDDLDLQCGLAPEARPQPDQQGNHDATLGPPRAYQATPLSSIVSVRTEFTIGTAVATYFPPKRNVSPTVKVVP